MELLAIEWTKARQAGELQRVDFFALLTSLPKHRCLFRRANFFEKASHGAYCSTGIVMASWTNERLKPVGHLLRHSCVL